MPEDVPAGFVKPRWRPHVFTAGGMNRRFYEICALAELRLGSCWNVWVTGSRSISRRVR